MPEPFRYPGPAPFAPPTKVLIECPGCGHLNKPESLVVCGRCWRLVSDVEQAILVTGPESLRAAIYEKLRRAQP